MKSLLLLFLLFLQVSGYLLSEDLKWGKIENLQKLNTGADEFAPSWNKFSSTLFFNSTIDGYSKFYISKMGNNQFSDSQILTDELNQRRNNQSYITFESATKAYLSTFTMYDSRPYLNIFQTFKKGSTWLKPIKLDSFNISCFVGHPTVSDDGKNLVFATTYNSYYKDTDLWMATKQENGSWGTLILLSNLQTPGNEITPFFAGNDTLYFASDGQEGYGGYDIFYSVKSDGMWQKPFPIEEVNSEFDESDFIIIPDKNIALFASNSPGGKGGLDLYKAERKKIETSNSDNINVDFTLAVQVPSIKVESQGSRSLELLNTTYILKKNFYDEQLKISKSNFDYLNFYQRSFEEIGNRIKNLQESIIYCSIFGNNYGLYEKKNIEKRILEYLGLTEENVKFNFGKVTDGFKMQIGDEYILIKLRSNNRRVFETFMLKHFYSISLKPHILDIQVDSKQSDLLTSCKLFISCDNEKKYLIDEINNFPFKTYYDLKEIGSDLLVSDSLKFELEARDSLDVEHIHKQMIVINHNSTEEEKYIVNNNKKYEDFHLIISDYKDLRDNNAYSNFVNIILSEATNQQILIRYFDESSYILAEKIKAFILDNPGTQNIQIDLILTENDDFEEPLSKYIFQILTEH